MSNRAARRKSLTEIDRLQFVQDATDAHHRLAPYLIALSPLSDDYKAIQRLSQALRTAIRDVTADDPEWCKVKPGAYPGR